MRLLALGFTFCLFILMALPGSTYAGKKQAKGKKTNPIPVDSQSREPNLDTLPGEIILLIENELTQTERFRLAEVSSRFRLLSSFALNDLKNVSLKGKKLDRVQFQ